MNEWLVCLDFFWNVIVTDWWISVAVVGIANVEAPVECSIGVASSSNSAITNSFLSLL